MWSSGAVGIRGALARLASRVKARTVDRPWFRWVVWATVGLMLCSVALAAMTGVGALVNRRPVDYPMELLEGGQSLGPHGRYEWQLQAAMSLGVAVAYLVLAVWLVRGWRRRGRELAEGAGAAGAST